MSVGVQSIEDLEARVEREEWVDNFRAFLKNYHKEEVLEFARGYPKDSRSFYIDWMELFGAYPDLADDLLTHWDKVLPHALVALHDFPLPIDIDLSGARVRVTNIQGEGSGSVESVRADSVGQLVALKGRTKKVSQVEMYPREAEFVCQRCGAQTTIPQGTGEFQEPYQCESCERQGPFKMDKRRTDWENAQLMRLEQPVEETNGGNAATIDVVLRGDVAEGLGEDGYEAGELVTVTGVVDVQEPDSDSGQLPTGTPVLTGQTVTPEEDDFDSLDITQEDKDEIQAIADGTYHDDYDKPMPLLTNGIAPKHHGDHQIKTALVLQAVAGNEVDHGDGTTNRGDFHILLLGDPGTGKSRLLDRMKTISPRSAMTSGKGASAAGLTAAAVPSTFGDAKWDLEAGALVMASGGVACVDEIDKMDEEARSSLHEALATQSVSINKAGINATLETKAACLAAGNPKYGRFDQYENIGDQIDLDPALMSRFDLMFMVTDQPDPEDDYELGKAIVDDHREEAASDTPASEKEPGPIPDELLTKYVAYARQNVNPNIESDAVAEKMVNVWVNLRADGYDENSPVPVTVRKLDAIRRLSEASARARLSEVVEAQDVKRAADVVMKVMKDVGVDPETDEFDADVIHTGMSKSQRDRIKNLKAILEELDDEFDDGVPVDELYLRAEENGIDREKAEHELSKLKAKGEAYQPHGDTVRPM
jgi:replicative DNA helicase Mcm